MVATIGDWIYYAGLAVYFATVASCVFVILSENRNPIRSLAWVIALVALPVAGLVFYLFFGRSMRSKMMISRHSKRRLLHSRVSRKVDFSELSMTQEQKALVKLCSNIAKAPLTLNNEITIFTDGVSKFDTLKRDLADARHTIYLQYYIFSDDRIGREISDLLIAKAKAGVTVKVIYDHVGSFSAKSRFFKRMRAGGVDVHPFYRVTFPQLANRINWRNHRKLVIIDNEIGYVGGMNIADRYVKGKFEGGVWRDTHFRVCGEIVSSLIFSFAVDWSFMNQPLIPEFHRARRTPVHNNVGMQLVTSGPTGSWDNLTLCFLKAISSARRSIYIQTPYFLPTDSLLHALEAAAIAEIDVRIMIPSRCDSRLLQLATFSYVTTCLQAGMKVYLYDPGMLHSKAMIIDEDLVTAGSTNFDFRSFENNFECNLFVYDREVNKEMRRIFFDDLEHCTKLTFETWRRRPVLQRTLESLVRLMAPVL